MKLAHLVVLIQDGEYETVLCASTNLMVAQMIHEAAGSVFLDERYELEIRDQEVAEDTEEAFQLFKDIVLEIGDEEVIAAVFGGTTPDPQFEIITEGNEEIIFSPQTGEIVSHTKDMGELQTNLMRELAEEKFNSCLQQIGMG